MACAVGSAMLVGSSSWWADPLALGPDAAPNTGGPLWVASPGSAIGYVQDAKGAVTREMKMPVAQSFEIIA